MADESKDKLTVPGAPTGGGLAERHKIGGSKLHARVAAAGGLQPPPVQAQPLTQPPRAANPFDSSLEMPNRIGMMLDCSSSMDEVVDGGFGKGRGWAGKDKMHYLKEAVNDFITNCDFNSTAIAIETFPETTDEDEIEFYRPNRPNPDDPLAHLLPPTPPPQRSRSAKRRSGLCNVEAFLRADIDSLDANGSTPMAPAMDRALMRNSVTRGVLVSDGEADNRDAALESARQWKKAETMIDCVHIGRSTSGEDLLKKIAEITGGMYIKFDNVENFAKHFKYLTPAYRAMLTSGSAGLLGAKEVK